MNTENKDKVYDGWLVSPNFFKRAFAIWGHLFVVNFIMGFFIFLFLIILGVSLFSVLVSSGKVHEYLGSQEFQNILNNGELRIKDGDTEIFISSGKLNISGDGILKEIDLNEINSEILNER